VQTRPGDNEPERDPEESAEDAGTEERDPFTPKVQPSGEDDAEEPGAEAPGAGELGAEGSGAGESAAEQSAAEKPDLTETVDLRSAEPEEPAAGSGGKQERHKHRGQMAAETVKLPPVDAAEDETDESGSQEAAAQPGQRSGGSEPESETDSGAAEAEEAGAAAEGRAADGAEPEAATEVEAEAEKPGAQKAGSAERPEPLAETVDLRDLLPEEPAAEPTDERAESVVSIEPTEPVERPSPDLAQTVNLRDFVPEDSADKPGERPDRPEPPIRRRTPAEGEPPRRRPAPGGQPPRRPGPGPDPRRVPHAGEPGPRRRPPSERPDHPGMRRPAPEPRPAAGAAAAAAAPGPAAPPPVKPVSVSVGRRRLFAALWPPRLSRNQAVVGVLLAALGAALAIQVRATNTSDQILRGARADDLVNILDEVTSRGQSLDAELRNLETQNAAIQDSADKAQAALTQAQQKTKDLQILAGTIKAKGSGITMTITDPKGQMKSATLLNALEELRAAGAEVVQVNDVRVIVSSSFVDTPDGGIALDGHELAKPYVYKVIGDPNTLGPAMQIPGGVVATVKSSDGANATITPGQVLVDAVVPPPSPDYAKAG